MSDMLYSDKSKLTAKPDQTQQGPEAAPNISPMRIQRLGAMDLQRLVGNQATQRLLRQADTSAPAVVQTKMTVGAADDAYEQEADRVAQSVVSDSAPVQRESEGAEDEMEAIQTMRIQREAEGAEMEEEELQTMRIQREAEEDEMQLTRVQREAEGAEMEEEELQTMRIQREEVDMMDSFDAGEDVESGIASTRGSGQALPDDTRGMLESKMGYDFGGVNIHTDSTADSLNRSVSAKAFTTGNDVYFSQGAYNPGSKDGQQLLAHELTHVVQQGGAAPKVQTDREEK